MDGMIRPRNTSAFIMQGTNAISSMIAGLPAALQQDEQYKRATAAFQSVQQRNADVYDTTVAALGQVGVDGAAVLGNRESYLNAEPEVLEKKIGTIITNLSQSKQVDPGKLSAAIQSLSSGVPEAAQGNINRRQGVDRFKQQYGTDPMAQQAPTQQPQQQPNLAMQAGQEAPGLTMALQGLPQTSTPQADPMAAQPTARKAGSMGEAGQDFIDKLQNLTLSYAESGNASPEKLYEMQGKIESSKYDLKLKEMDLELADKKSYQQYLATQADKREVKAGGDKIMTFAEFKNADFTVGDRMAPQPTYHYSNGGGSGGAGDTNRDKPTASLLQANELEKQLANISNKRGPSGELIVLSEDPTENERLFKQRYKEKEYDVAKYKLADQLELTGETANTAQLLASKVLDTSVTIDNDHRGSSVITDGQGRFVGLNLANQQLLSDLVLYAKRGQSASSLLRDYKALKALNPSIEAMNTNLQLPQ